MGTVQYMSPEQIQGHEADARSDLFAFDATLYEMLSGKRAFQGKSQLSVASAILEKDPEPLNTLQPLTPLPLERVVRKCLAKDPEDRWQNARDLATELRWIAEGGTPGTAAGNEAAAKGRIPLKLLNTRATSAQKCQELHRRQGNSTVENRSENYWTAMVTWSLLVTPPMAI